MKAHQRKDGSWEAKGIDPISLKRKSYYASTESEAAKKAERSLGVQNDNSLFSYYANVYLPTVAHRSENWKYQIGWAMDGYILPEFGHREIDGITRQEFQRFFNSLLSKMKVASIKRMKIVLSGVYNLAEDDEVVSKNPVRRVRLPISEEPDKTALTFEQLRTLLDSAHDLAKPVIILGGCCGLRLGEICGQTRNFDGNLMKVRQQILQPKGGCVISRTLKTPQSKRDIPLPEGLKAILGGDSLYLAPNTQGGYLTPNNATRELKIACEKVGLKITPHELRHTFISLMENELEAPPAIVACLAGRKYQGENAGYSHTHRKQLEKWMARFWERTSTSTRQNDVVREA